MYIRRVSLPHYWTLILAFILSSYDVSPIVGQALQSCSCPRVFSPVCGSNGKTYNNRCQLDCAKNQIKDLDLAYNGPCCPSAHCPSINQPVCDSQGTTHENECTFRHEACVIRRKMGVTVTLANKGPCVSVNCVNNCSQTLDFVCDNLGNTHDNLCLLEYASCLSQEKNGDALSSVHDGPCGDGPVYVDAAAILPADADTTLTYDSDTTASDYYVTEDLGETEPADVMQCNALCTSEKEPICGDDGITHTNRCMFDYYNCELEKSGAPISEVLHEGPCGNEKITPRPVEEKICEDKCPMLYRPVCGTDDRTYRNLCALQYENCRRTKNGTFAIIVKNEGPCNPALSSTASSVPESQSPEKFDCDSACSTLMKPVCNEEGKYFPNECAFRKENCRLTAEGKSPQEMKPCPSLHSRVPSMDPKKDCQFGCSKIYAPVCDNFGDTHSNKCMFDYKNCLRMQTGRESLQIVKNGECGSRKMPTTTTEKAEEPTKPTIEFQQDGPPLSQQAAARKQPDVKIAAGKSGKVPRPRPKGAGDRPVKGKPRSKFNPKDEKDCNFNCRAILSPVCDGKNETYMNLCEFDQASCLNELHMQESLILAKHGSCGDEHQETVQLLAGGLPAAAAACSQECNSASRPLCDSMGKTHPNECIFEYNRCVASGNSEGQNITIAFHRACEDPPPEPQPEPELSVSVSAATGLANCGDYNCTDAPAPVCDQRNVTYTNWCQFDYAKCVSAEIKGIVLEISHEGSCEENEIDQLYNETETAEAEKPEPPKPDEEPKGKGKGGKLGKGKGKLAGNLREKSGENAKQNRKSPAKPEEQLHNAAVLSEVNQAYKLDDTRALWTGNSISRNTSGECFYDCSDILEPLCDIEGIEYKNPCLFNLARCNSLRLYDTELTVAYFGPCQQQMRLGSYHVLDDSVICYPGCDTLPYDPVCSDSGDSYANLCAFQYQSCVERLSHGSSMSIRRRGLCSVPSPTDGCNVTCPDETDSPVCDTSGHTHLSLCSFNKASCLSYMATGQALDIAMLGTCDPTVTPEILQLTICPENCPNATPSDIPLCDSLNQTHTSLCNFKLASCLARGRQDAELTVQHVGACVETPSLFPPACAFRCSEDTNPVCDSEGLTHINLCNFKKERCDRLQIKSGELSLVHFGECQRGIDYLAIDTCSPICTKDSDPVCDHLGETHQNMCIFNYQSCLHRNVTGRSLEVAYRGPCGSVEHSETDPLVLNIDGNTMIRPKPDADVSILDLSVQKRAGVETNQALLTNEKEPCSFHCFNETLPLCDNENRTHENPCMFNYENCQRKIGNREELIVNHIGGCNRKSVPFSANLEVCPKSCPKVTHQKLLLCDEDGYTHENFCSFKMLDCSLRKRTGMGRRIAHIGSCEKSALKFGQSAGRVQLDEPVPGSICEASCSTDDYDPLCDINGKTYGNICVFEYQNCLSLETGKGPIEIAYPGPCRKEDRKIVDKNMSKCHLECASTYSPVCSLKNETFTNLCHFQQKNCIEEIETGGTLNLGYFGECGRPSVDDKTMCPNGTICRHASSLLLCDNEATTHANVCMFNIARCLAAKLGRTLTISHYGKCVASDCAAMECESGEATQVCGTDLVTYSSACELRQSQCALDKSQEQIEILFKGPCEQCVRKCDATYAPVCNNLKRTHNNLCEFKVAECIYMMKYREPLKIAYEGMCCEKECPVADQNQTVCDTRGVTYSSLCVFEIEQCLQLRTANVSIEIAYEGQCITGSGIRRKEKIPEIPLDDGRVELIESVVENPVEAEPNAVEPEEPNAAGEPEPLAVDEPEPSAEGEPIEPGVEFSDHDEAIEPSVVGEPNAPAVDTDLLESAVDGGPLEPAIDGELVEPPVNGELLEPAIASKPVEPAIDGEPLEPTVDGEPLEPVIAGEPIDLSIVGEPPQPAIAVDPLEPVVDGEPINPVAISEFIEEVPRLIELTEPADARPQQPPASGNTAEATAIAGDLLSRNDCDYECQDEGEPVCGADGKTYTSACHLSEANCRNSESIGMVYRGTCCFMDNDCDPTYRPVCDSLGRSHPNICLFERAKCELKRRDGTVIRVVYEGECCERKCPPVWSPICDNFGKTHANLCRFEEQKCLMHRKESKALSVVSAGLCAGSCARNCSNVYEPVCASDGRTYPSDCYLDVAACVARKHGSSILLDHMGECCPQNCTFTYDPVCDSEGQTHINPCVFQAEQCRAHRLGANSPQTTPLTIRYAGPCCQRVCTQEPEPLCDSKGGTHINMCHFRISQCEAEHRGEGVSLEYRGSCCELRSGCASEAVCGTDGRTYPDLCSLEHQSCLSVHKFNLNITQAYEGECCQYMDCPAEKMTLCDNAGRTHTNLCAFNNFKCEFERRNPGSLLEVAYEGECCVSECSSSEGDNPVCDQHGTVYANRCLFDLEACGRLRKDDDVLLLTPCAKAAFHKN